MVEVGGDIKKNQSGLLAALIFHFLLSGDVNKGDAFYCDESVCIDVNANG